MIYISIVIAVSAVASGIAAIFTMLNHKKIKEVHVLVNNRLDTALETIARLKTDLKTEKEK